MQPISQIVLTLNKMMDINGQRVNRYKSLADKAKEIEMKIFYMQFAIQAQTFTATLNKWRTAYGIASHTLPKEGILSSAIGQLKRVINLGSKDFDLKQCEEMESNALKTYKTALSLAFLPSATTEDIVRQTEELENTHFTLKTFRENGSEQWQASSI
ncbi:hypothetical protein BH10BAC4_BH10BAC4_12430 [soil metagenome]